MTSSSTAKTNIPNSTTVTNENNSSSNSFTDSQEQIMNSNINPYLAETTQFELEPLSTIPKPISITQTSSSSFM